ncbi:MAG: Rieske 2Fe-2S domain-containing protein [Verrucomicrobiales bacterium]|nr:Rieske 2Fe-2S domain-containing protein [Verrucomicrobiales bacterium]
MNRISVGRFSNFEINTPVAVKVENVDLVVTRYGEREVSVLFGKCRHHDRVAEGQIKDETLICPDKDCKFHVDSGVTEKGDSENLKKFSHQIKFDYILVDPEEIRSWYESKEK